MNFHRSFRRLATGVMLCATSAGAAVTVSFVDSDRYTDIGAHVADPQQAMNEIARHLERLGERYLAPQQALKIEVLDVDLAGRVRWVGRSMRELRILDGTGDGPGIRLRYTLESGGSVITTREETLTDRGYLSAHGAVHSGESLYYEKRMLSDWFRARFGEGQPAR